MRWHLIPESIRHHEMKEWEEHAIIAIGAILLVGGVVSGIAFLFLS